MIFNLPPILGFIPLILYIILSLKGTNLLAATVISMVISFVLTGKGLLTAGVSLQSALGEFLTLVGFIIMLGSGLGEVLKKTKVAENLVHLVLDKLKIRTQKQSLILAFSMSMILTALLGTGSGANATISPIILPVVASLGIAPGVLGIMLIAGGLCGMILGPFTPTAVIIRELSGLTYTELIITASFPLSIIIFGTSFYFSLRLQKRGGDGEAYSEADKAAAEDYKANPYAKRGTYAFLISMFAMIVYGVIAGAGASFAIVIMLLVAIVVAVATKTPMEDFLNWFFGGCGKMVHIFCLFVCFCPLLNNIVASGAFSALVELVSPIITGSSKVVFVMVSSCIGIFGIAGAAVDQAQVIHDLFSEFIVTLGIPASLWANIIMYGCVLTSLSMPNPDILAPLGLAHSSNLKTAMKCGYAIIIISLAVLLIRSVIML